MRSFFSIYWTVLINDDDLLFIVIDHFVFSMRMWNRVELVLKYSRFPSFRPFEMDNNHDFSSFLFHNFFRNRTVYHKIIIINIFFYYYFSWLTTTTMPRTRMTALDIKAMVSELRFRLLGMKVQNVYFLFFSMLIQFWLGFYDLSNYRYDVASKTYIIRLGNSKEKVNLLFESGIRYVMSLRLWSIGSSMHA